MAGRNIIYYQTIQDDYSKYLADSPFTHIYLASIHIHEDLSVYLNDWVPEDPRYETLWTQWVPQWIAAGKSVMLLVGGWGNGTTWQTIKKDLDDTPPPQEPVIIQRLLGLVEEHGLAGIDLDIEQYYDPVVPLVEAFVSRIQQYAPDITITMSPTPDQLADVDTILADAPDALEWENVQMYCWFVSAKDLASSYAGYLGTYKHFKPEHLVAGVCLQSENPACCASTDDLCTYAGQIQKLASGYADFGGTAMWEYEFVFSNDYAKQWPDCSAQALVGERCSYCGK